MLPVYQCGIIMSVVKVLPNRRGIGSSMRSSSAISGLVSAREITLDSESVLTFLYCASTTVAYPVFVVLRRLHVISEE